MFIAKIHTEKYFSDDLLSYYDQGWYKTTNEANNWVDRMQKFQGKFKVNKHRTQKNYFHRNYK